MPRVLVLVSFLQYRGPAGGPKILRWTNGRARALREVTPSNQANLSKDVSTVKAAGEAMGFGNVDVERVKTTNIMVLLYPGV
jgi:hypothetical protein